MYIEIAFFFVWGGEGGWCFVLCRYCQVRYIHHATYISYICNFPCLEVDFLFIYYYIYT